MPLPSPLGPSCTAVGCNDNVSLLAPVRNLFTVNSTLPPSREQSVCTRYLLTETSHYSKEVCMAMFWKVFTRTYGRSWSSSVVETGRRNLLLPQGLVNITMPRRGFLANVVSAVTNYHSCGVFAPSLAFQPWPSAAYTPFPPSRLLQRVAKRIYIILGTCFFF